MRVLHTRTIVDPRYGAKLTGKTGDTTIGVMYTDDEAPGNLDNSDDPGFGHSAQTFVGRLRYDLYSESYVGMIFSARDFFDSSNQSAGSIAIFVWEIHIRLVSALSGLAIEILMPFRQRRICSMRVFAKPHET